MEALFFQNEKQNENEEDHEVVCAFSLTNALVPAPQDCFLFS
jgi:hypothetical protein